MSWFSLSTAPRVFALLMLGVLWGCPSAHPCASHESCNGKDDDCDGRADEDFLDERGRYVDDEHCGGCGVACAEVFPTASATRCDSAPEVPICRLESCPAGSHQSGGGACIADQTVLCLPCTSDDDCSARLAGARCEDVGGERRCGIPCDSSNPCPTPFRCDAATSQCRPLSSLCACQGVSETFEVACLAEGSAPGLQCAGVQTCSPMGLGMCQIASVESCNGQDDNCDGRVDESFRDAQGRYVDRLHCGECNKPCVAPGPNYLAACGVNAGEVTCQVDCERGFVDVDGIRGNGCECQIFDGTTAPVVVGGDANCDGIIDDNDTFIHVTSAGSDSQPGTLVKPMRTIQAAIARGKMEKKTVLVAQGSYDAFEILGGVSVFGGYRSDFRDRDPELYPVVVEHQRPADGAPVLSCVGVTEMAVVDGLTLVGSDAESAGRGSTALFIDGCGPQVRLAHVTVLAGRGADGARGDDASRRLPDGIDSLAELDGRDGSAGFNGDAEGQSCVTISGGAAGAKMCGSGEVSGGAGGAAACPDLRCRNGSACANAGCTDFTVGGVCDYDRVLASAVPNPTPGSGRGPMPGKAGAVTYNAPTSRGVCAFCDDNPSLPRLGQDGSDGANGSSGFPGFGCEDPVLGLDSSGRASAGAGLGGLFGTDGSGGGGGSAGNGFSVINGTSGTCDDSAGGSGGGGGSGGCGAPGGAGGAGGGASIAIVLRATAEGKGPSFDSVRVVTASGGRGGDGGVGAAGGRGGAGAAGGQSRFWCSRNGGRGGNGGSGGAGGGGGGGCGGASHALFFAGSPSNDYRELAQKGLSIELAGVPGQGGLGGFSPGYSGTPGVAGAADAVR